MSDGSGDAQARRTNLIEVGMGNDISATVTLVESAAQAPAAPSRLRSRRRLVILGYQVLVAAVALVIWQVCATYQLLDTTVISSPKAVFGYLFGHAIVDPELWTNTYYTMVATLIAFVVGSVLGILVGLVCVRIPTLEEIFDPFVTLMNSFPRIALAPLFVVWFGIGVTSKVVLAVSVIFFILMLTTIAGARSVDRNLIALCNSLGAGPWKIFRSITIPTAAPSIFAGLKLGLIYSFLGAIVGEMIASEHGLGQEAMKYSNLFQMDRVLAVLFFLAVITTLLAAGMTAVERRVLRWQRI
jgi:NitT/TauT family transport system permease protein